VKKTHAFFIEMIRSDQRSGAGAAGAGVCASAHVPAGPLRLARSAFLFPKLMAHILIFAGVRLCCCATAYLCNYLNQPEEATWPLEGTNFLKGNFFFLRGLKKKLKEGFFLKNGVFLGFLGVRYDLLSVMGAGAGLAKFCGSLGWLLLACFYGVFALCSDILV
jgi:hypothetical protein